MTGVVAGLGAINAGLVALAISHEDRLFKSERDVQKLKIEVDELQYSLYTPIKGKVQYSVSKTEDGTCYVQDGNGEILLHLPPKTSKE